MAEGAPLLREYGVNSSIEGSNPSLSAIHFAQSLSQQGLVVPHPNPDLQLYPQDARSDAQNSTGHGADRPVALDDLRHPPAARPEWPETRRGRRETANRARKLGRWTRKSAVSAAQRQCRRRDHADGGVRTN